MKIKRQIHVAILPFFDMVLFPKTSVPLVLQDAIYIKLIKDCVNNSIPVAICLAEPVVDEDNARPNKMIKTRKVAGVGIPKIVKEREDGSIHVILEGIGKIHLSQLVQSFPYLIFQGTYLEDEEEMIPGHHNLLFRKLQRVFDEWVGTNFPDFSDQVAIKEKIKTPEKLINYLAMFIIQDREVKQVLLEADSLMDKIYILNLLLSKENFLKEDPSALSALKSFEEIEKTKVAIH